jgi:predicted nucleic-acid-binding protein
MIGLDTNVLVRYLTKDDPVQAKAASSEIDQGAARGDVFFIAPIVLCELVWVLRSAYGLNRAEIGQTLDRILRTKQFEFREKDLLWEALADYRRGKGDFSDHIIGRLGKSAGCTHTITLDTRLKSNPLFHIL